MRNSDVFNEFIKIAQQKGMVSMDSDETKKKLENNPRADSLDISAIEALYGVKPDAPKSMEYEHNIMEIAHPNSAVVAPSYDKLNGLVENDIERQNITINIINQTPNGALTQKKYAQKDLFLHLIKIANDLDNKNQSELMNLADMCLLQVNSVITKKANPLLIGAAAVAAVLGGIYFKNHMRFISDGFEKDHQKLIAELNDLISSNTSTQTQLGAGYTFKPAFIQLMQDFKNKLTTYYNLYTKIAPHIDQLEQPHTASELQEMAKKPETNEIMDSYKAFRKATEELLPFILKIEENFDNEDFKSRQIVEKGTFMGLLDATQVLHGGKGLIADDFDDVYHALKTYVYDIQNIMKALQNAESISKSVLKDIQNSSYQSSELFGGEKSKPVESTNTSEKSNQDLDNEAKELSNLLDESGFTG